MTPLEAHNHALAHATFVRDDVLGNLKAWRETTLDGTRSLLLEWFAQHLNSMDLDGSVPFDDRATMVADGVIHQWCLQRRFFGGVFNQTLASATPGAVQQAGMAEELGRLAGQHIDDAMRALDAELREMIEEAAQAHRH